MSYVTHADTFKAGISRQTVVSLVRSNRARVLLYVHIERCLLLTNVRTANT